MTKSIRLAITGLAFLLGATGCATPPVSPQAFSFAMIGDQQYTPREEQIFPQMLDAIGAEDLAFVVHIGDIKSGGNSHCTDELYLRRRDEFNRSRHALVFTPGDNDWVDCRRPSNGATDPIERLAKMREVFFSSPYAMGANRLPLLRQSAQNANHPELSIYRENAMWLHGGVVFLTLNIQGSNDNLGFDAVNDREHAERTRANIAWLKQAVARAANSDIHGLAIFLQANPGFEETRETVEKSGYAEFLAVFDTEAAKLGKPVLFGHGDTHQHRVDRPYTSPLSKRQVGNVIRVESFGSPHTDWLRITVDSANPAGLFSIKAGGFVPSEKSKTE